MENKAHALAAGAFVLLTGAMLVALAMWLTRDTGVRHVYELSTRDAVSGLQPQAAVRYRGIDVGKVLHIGFDPQTTGNALVRIAVDDRAPVTKSTFATLSYQGVTGLAFVQLDDDGQSSERLPGDADNPPRIPMHPGLVSKLVDQGTAIMSQAQQTMARVTELLSPENQRALLAMIHDLGTAANGISKTAASLEAVSADARKTLRVLETASMEIARTAVEANATAAEIGRNVQGVSTKFGETADVLISAAHMFHAATLPRVHRVTEDTSTTMRQATRTFSEFSANPQALIYGGGPIAPGPGEPGFVAPRRNP